MSVIFNSFGKLKKLISKMIKEYMSTLKFLAQRSKNRITFF